MTIGEVRPRTPIRSATALATTDVPRWSVRLMIVIGATLAPLLVWLVILMHLSVGAVLISSLAGTIRIRT